MLNWFKKYLLNKNKDFTFYKNYYDVFNKLIFFDYNKMLFTGDEKDILDINKPSMFWWNDPIEIIKRYTKRKNCIPFKNKEVLTKIQTAIGNGRVKITHFFARSEAIFYAAPPASI
jgi:hypothetical protein